MGIYCMVEQHIYKVTTCSSTMQYIPVMPKICVWHGSTLRLGMLDTRGAGEGGSPRET